MITTPATQLPEPPLAPGLPLIGNTLTFMNNKGFPIDVFQELSRTHEDVVRFKVGNQNLYLVIAPELVRDVLVKRIDDFQKTDSTDKEGLSRFLGQGLLTARHDLWKPQRKLIQPLMHTQQISNYADTMAESSQKLLDLWQDGAVRDVHADMIQVTMWIIAETMFGMSYEQSPALQQAGEQAQEVVLSELKSLPIPLLKQLRDYKANRINQVLSEIVTNIMEERRKDSGEGRNDLLTLLMNAKFEDGAHVPDTFVRDNILTLFFAGHETTANTLTWVFYYLDQHPEVIQKLQEEADRVLDGRLPTFNDLHALSYHEMVIKETMRIEPTVSAYPRLTLADVELGGYHIKANSVVLVSPYIMHHSPRWWDNPDQFNPNRFTPENEANIPKYAYMPFGGGPRICIGAHFSMMESVIILAMIMSRYQLSRVSQETINPLRLVTTAPEGGLKMRIKRR